MSIEYQNKINPLFIKRSTHLGCKSHLHKEIEVIYMVNGNSKAYLDGVSYDLHAGDLFMAFPNQVHAFETNSYEDYFILIFSPEVFSDFSALMLKKVPEKPVHHFDNADFEKLLTDAQNALESDCPNHRIICKGFLTVFFGMTLSAYRYRDVSAGNADMLPSVLSYCTCNYKENITLDSMAASLHASKYYISRLFSEKVHIGFNDYIHMLRINEAKELLVKTDDSITQIGIEVGYNTIRSFNRAFLAQTDLQPREYRNKYRVKK